MIIKRDHFRFDSVFIKKIIKLNFLKKPETESKPVQIDWFQFSFLGQNPVPTNLARFFQFSSVFRFGFSSVRFF